MKFINDQKIVGSKQKIIIRCSYSFGIKESILKSKIYQIERILTILGRNKLYNYLINPRACLRCIFSVTLVTVLACIFPLCSNISGHALCVQKADWKCIFF